MLQAVRVMWNCPGCNKMTFLATRSAARIKIMNLHHRHGLPLTRPAISFRGERHERVAEIKPILITDWWNPFSKKPIMMETRSNVLSLFLSPKPMANSLRPWRVNSSTWSFTIETKGVTAKTQACSCFHKSFSRCSSNWKTRLCPKSVGRIPKTSHFCGTVSRHSFYSCFKPEIMW